MSDTDSRTYAYYVRGGAIDVIYSPDDGCYYLRRYWFDDNRTATSKHIYRSEADAIKAARSGRVRWEDH